MRATFYLAAFLFLLIFSCSPKEQSIQREILFNNDWKFIRTDVTNGQDPALDDVSWRSVDLPHDYSIEDLPDDADGRIIGPFSTASPGGASTGQVIGGTAWYRKHFTLGETDRGKIVQVLFDGIYMNADVWINGHHLGNHPYGYTAFSYELTAFLNPAGEDNILAVQVKNEGKNSRWYSGSGIYRDVTLMKTDPVHFDLWGVYVSTPDVSAEKATVQLEVKLVNQSDAQKALTVKTSIIGPEGNLAAESTSSVNINAAGSAIAEVSEDIPSPELWSHDHPALYKAKIQLLENNQVIDEVEERFGIRTTEFSAEKGFLLNGENVLLKGACMHHDNGPLGAAAFEGAEYRRVRLMKEYGFNAIRCSHNPPSKLFLDACDELGMLVMDESFDQWQRPKNPEDYNLYFDDWWEKDMESMVLRDRNHPSIIIWSIGNEVNERADSSGLVIAKNMKEKILEMDKTRPVTQAICHFWDHPGRPWDDTAPAFAQMDVHGYNYRWGDYEPDHTKHPDRIMIGTESFPMDAFENWDLVEKHPYVIGDFVWTGMDYLGESGIGHTKLDGEEQSFLPGGTWFNAYCGDISILGYKKPQMYYRDVVWRNSHLEILVHAPIPEGRKELVSYWGWPEEWKSWNWRGQEGKTMHVSVYTRCDQVRLELNGKVIGTKDVVLESPPRDESQGWTMERQIQALVARFEVPFQPGELLAVGIKDGKEVDRQRLRTSEEPAALRITAEKPVAVPGGRELAYFNVEVVDEKGSLVTNAVIPIEFDIAGQGSLLAVANGNPNEMKSFQQPGVNTFRGRCQVIVRTGKEEGDIKVIAKSNRLRSGEAMVQVRK